MKDSFMNPHAQKVAVITGASRGIAGLHPVGRMGEIGSMSAGD
jgi:hypothetical protein